MSTHITSNSPLPAHKYSHDLSYLEHLDEGDWQIHVGCITHPQHQGKEQCNGNHTPAQLGFMIGFQEESSCLARLAVTAQFLRKRDSKLNKPLMTNFKTRKSAAVQMVLDTNVNNTKAIPKSCGKLLDNSFPPECCNSRGGSAKEGLHSGNDRQRLTHPQGILSTFWWTGLTSGQNPYYNRGLGKLTVIEGQLPGRQFSKRGHPRILPRPIPGLHPARSKKPGDAVTTSDCDKFHVWRDTSHIIYWVLQRESQGERWFDWNVCFQMAEKRVESRYWI